MNSFTYAIGIDIGGTTTTFGIADQDGQIIYTGKLFTRASANAAVLLNAIAVQMEPAIQNIGRQYIAGVGIGAPNGNFYTGTVDYAPNLPWKGPVPLADIARQVFGMPCVVTNDANAAAMGEMMYGAARGMRDFIMLTLGTGIGSGIVCNGQVVYGHDGFAGELGHMIARRGRIHPGTGADGPLEVYASATGIAATAREMLQTWPADTLLKQVKAQDIDARLVSDCAHKGDPLAQQVYAFTGEVLGEALANFVMFSSPEAIILFGGVTSAGDLLLNPVRAHMEKNLLPIYRNKIKLLYSQLSESNAAILGACALVTEPLYQRATVA